MTDDTALRALAIAVLRSAVHDLRAPSVRERHRAATRAFLAEGGALLELWATLAGLEAARLRRAVFQVVPPRPGGERG